MNDSKYSAKNRQRLARGRIMVATRARIRGLVSEINTQGNTEHFQIGYADNLGDTGATIADGVLTTCETDFTMEQVDLKTLSVLRFCE